VRITQLDERPFYELPYLNASRRGGAETARLPFYRGRAEGLPAGCEAVVCASDLQGRVGDGGELILLGEALADQLEVLSSSGMLPPPEATAVLLAGDLYTVPGADKRGGTGDVRSVWECLAVAARWVVGVAGNHDDFGTERQRRRLAAIDNVVILDGDVRELGGVSFGGVGYVVGNPNKPGKRQHETQSDLLEDVLAAGPEILIVHEGPEIGRRQAGSPHLTSLLDNGPGPRLVICGHHAWSPARGAVGESAVLNVHERVVVLEPA
jgi:hypothetical protein